MQLKDSLGNGLPIDKVTDLATANVRGSLSREDLIDSYVNGLSERELVEWATDENGEFPQGA